MTQHGEAVICEFFLVYVIWNDKNKVKKRESFETYISTSAVCEEHSILNQSKVF